MESRLPAEAGEQRARVLLIARSACEFAQVREQLERQNGCECEFANSYTAAMELVEREQFDLILSSGQPGIRALVATVLGSPVSLYCAHAIEDSCLWIPVVSNGTECLGEPPLRPCEFAETLKRIAGRRVAGLPAAGSISARGSRRCK